LSSLALAIGVLVHTARTFVDAAAQTGYVSGELMWLMTGMEATLSLLLGLFLMTCGVVAVRARPGVAAVALAVGALASFGVAAWLTSHRQLEAAFWPGVNAAIAFASLALWMLAELLAGGRPRTPR
jgi:hypothetical protein